MVDVKGAAVERSAFMNTDRVWRDAFTCSCPGTGTNESHTAKTHEKAN